MPVYRGGITLTLPRARPRRCSTPAACRRAPTKVGCDVPTPQAGRRQDMADTQIGSTMYTTLSPCDMCKVAPPWPLPCPVFFFLFFPRPPASPLATRSNRVPRHRRLPPLRHRPRRHRREQDVPRRRGLPPAARRRGRRRRRPGLPRAHGRLYRKESRALVGPAPFSFLSTPISCSGRGLLTK